MVKPSLISVIIPAYNAERYLPETLASVQAQTYKELEIIVIDDGSTDSTAMIVEQASRTDDRIRVIRQANLGVAAARNKGLTEARGEFVAPLDADDVWHPQNLALQIAALRAMGPDVAVSYSWFVCIDEHGIFSAMGPKIQFTQKQEVLLAQVQGNFIGNSSSTVMRKTAVAAVGGYDSTLRARDAQGCEDQALYIALARKWNYTFVPQYLIAYRKHPGSMSQDRERMARSQALVLADLRRLRPRLPSYWFPRAIAGIYEGYITTALLNKQWRKVAEIVKCSGRVSRWSVVELLGFRLPIRIVRFCIRRLHGRPALPEPDHGTVCAFWSSAFEQDASSASYPDAQFFCHPDREQA